MPTTRVLAFLKGFSRKNSLTCLSVMSQAIELEELGDFLNELHTTVSRGIYRSSDEEVTAMRTIGLRSSTDLLEALNLPTVSEQEVGILRAIATRCISDPANPPRVSQDQEHQADLLEEQNETALARGAELVDGSPDVKGTLGSIAAKHLKLRQVQ